MSHHRRSHGSDTTDVSPFERLGTSRSAEKALLILESFAKVIFTYRAHNAYIPCKEKFETEDPIQKRDLFRICARFPSQDLYK